VTRQPSSELLKDESTKKSKKGLKDLTEELLKIGEF
jgi:hypothetical protein